VIAAPLRNWLTKDADPSVRWRAHRELLDHGEDHPEVVRARTEIGREGWVASILANQLAEGQWTTPTTTNLYRPKYIATNWQVIVLGDLGATRADPRVAKAAELFLDRFSTDPNDGFGGSDSEVCFTGNGVRTMVRLGYGEDPRVRRGLEWLVRTQKPDGGWHCDPGARHGTLDCWQALAAFAALPEDARSTPVKRAVERGAEFYLDRELMREGRGRYEPWFRLHYPVHYYYDLLVGLDVLSSLGYGADRRLKKALDWLVARRRKDGRWPLDASHPDLPEGDRYGLRAVGAPHFSFSLEIPGHASRWITTTALLVLRRSGRL
jgi:prenyltransferase/squalene oxidase-like repeat protein